jgi:hypothetical protein
MQPIYISHEMYEMDPLKRQGSCLSSKTFGTLFDVSVSPKDFKRSPSAAEVEAGERFIRGVEAEALAEGIGSARGSRQEAPYKVIL